MDEASLLNIAIIVTVTAFLLSFNLLRLVTDSRRRNIREERVFELRRVVTESGSSNERLLTLFAEFLDAHCTFNRLAWLRYCLVFAVMLGFMGGAFVSMSFIVQLGIKDASTAGLQMLGERLPLPLSAASAEELRTAFSSRLVVSARCLSYLAIAIGMLNMVLATLLAVANEAIPEFMQIMRPWRTRR